VDPNFAISQNISTDSRDERIDRDYLLTDLSTDRADREQTRLFLHHCSPTTLVYQPPASSNNNIHNTPTKLSRRGWQYSSLTVNMVDNSGLHRRCLQQARVIFLINICIASFVLLKLVPCNNGSSNLYLPNDNYHRQLQSTKSTSDREYMYIIIHYHKTGHDLTRSLIDMVSSGISGVKKPVVWTRRTMLSTFSGETKVG
jgi:hypothetical protein